ncbi:MAG: HDIG domain-containing protein [Clostridiales bacterium]|jgi:tRNA nucleotidyltransferase (CCA-adding enzyme)|nr:HDIG domain-containing protein [Clostridiales bacterium]
MIDKENEVFEKITDHLIRDEFPSKYLNQESMEPLFQEYPLSLLLKLKKTEQSKKYHPEGNVWNHTMMVVDQAAKVKHRSSDERAFMWAALLHDIGKPGTTRVRKGRITSYDHDKVGAKISSDFLRVYTRDEDFIKRVCALVRYHMHMLYVLKELPFGDIMNLLKEVDIQDIALLSLCDRLGRTGADLALEEESYRTYLKKLEEAKAKVLQLNTF